MPNKAPEQEEKHYKRMNELSFLTATRGSAASCRHPHSWSAAGSDWEPVGSHLWYQQSLKETSEVNWKLTDDIELTQNSSLCHLRH